MVERLSGGHPAGRSHSDAENARLSLVFGALADPTRREILGRLRSGEATIGALADPFDMSLAAVSKHVQVLERAGLLSRRRRGREQLVSLDAAPLREISQWTREYEDFWNSRLDALERVIRAKKRGRKTRSKPRGGDR